MGSVWGCGSTRSAEDGGPAHHERRVAHVFKLGLNRQGSLRVGAGALGSAVRASRN